MQGWSRPLFSRMPTIPTGEHACQAVLGLRKTLYFMSTTLKRHWSQLKDTDSPEGGSQALLFLVQQHGSSNVP